MPNGEAAERTEARDELMGRPLSRRDKLWRGSVATLAVLGLLLLLLGPASLLAPFNRLARALLPSSPSPAATQSLPVSPRPSGTPAPTAPALQDQPAGRLTMSTWRQLALPPGGLARIAVAARPLHPGGLFACAAGSPTAGPPTTGPLRLWRSDDAASTWTALSLPPTLANTCALRIDPDNETRVAVLSSITDALAANTPSCTAATAYFSADGGIDWRRLELPAVPIAARFLYCDLWVTATHLFWYHYVLCPGGCQPLPRLDRSDDSGVTWHNADLGLPSADFAPVWSSDEGGDSFAVWVALRNGGDGAVPPQIWTTHDAGHSWHLQGSVTGASESQVFASHEPSWRRTGFDGGLYDSRIGPPTTGRVDLLTSDGGRPWYALPPLPLLGASRDLHSGIARVLGVGTGGNLLVLGGAPDQPPPAYDPTNTATPPSTPAWLWEWDRAAQRWSVSPLPVPFVAGDIAISWGAGNTFGGPQPPDRDGYGAYVWLTEQVRGVSQLYQAFVLAQ